MYVLGSEIDYVTELGGSFLKISNPQQKSSCGCGSSFGV
jgi:iron-sulfur cluster insertion protein